MNARGIDAGYEYPSVIGIPQISICTPDRLDCPDDLVGGEAPMIDTSEHNFEESVAQWRLYQQRSYGRHPDKHNQALCPDPETVGFIRATWPEERQNHVVTVRIDVQGYTDDNGSYQEVSR